MDKFPDTEQVSQLVLERVSHVSPPTDLHAVCKLWPDLSIIEEDLDKEGYLINLGVHGAELMLRKQDPLTRKKFTLAHELGHWVLSNFEGTALQFGISRKASRSFLHHQVRNTPEEMWCNRFAAALLMPRGDIAAYIGKASESGKLLDKVASGPSVFGVSQESFFSRVTEIVAMSLFEVVVVDRVPKVRRSFLNSQDSSSDVELTAREIANHFYPTRGFPEGSIQLGRFDAQVKLISESKYSQTWLLAIVRS